MKIDIKQLQDNYVKLNDIVEDYLSFFNNYYNEVNFIPNYWKSSKANYFTFITEYEKKDNKEFYLELSSLCYLYDYIIQKYSGLQDQLYINEDGIDLIVNKFLQNNIDNIVAKYDTIYTTSSSVLERLNVQKNKIQKNKNELLEYKDEIKGYYTKIKEIELDIKYKISECVIKNIYETSNEDKSLGDVDEIIYDISKLNLSYNKMKNYCKYFEDNYLDLEEIFKELNDNYNTFNSSNLEEIKNSLLIKYKTMKDNIYNNLDLLKKNIDNMTESSRIMKEAADNIRVTIDE